MTFYENEWKNKISGFGIGKDQRQGKKRIGRKAKDKIVLSMTRRTDDDSPKPSIIPYGFYSLIMTYKETVHFCGHPFSYPNLCLI